MLRETSYTNGWSVLRSEAPFAIVSIALVTTIVGLIGWLRWYTTGEWYGLVTFFRYPNAFFTLLFTGSEVGFSFYVRQQFLNKSTLRPAWTLLSLSAIAHFFGRLLSLAGSGGLIAKSNAFMVETGQVIGGPVQMALLLLGLIQVAACFRRLMLFRGLAGVDFLLLSMVGTLAVRTLFGVYQFLVAGNAVTWSQAALWTSDPLLLMLLLVAIVIRRSVSNIGYGILANCWRSYIIAIALTTVGDASLWCSSCSNFPLWNSLGWYIWLVADASYALGPAFQVAAIERVQMGSRMLREIALAN
jgi:hypothetical protein